RTSSAPARLEVGLLGLRYAQSGIPPFASGTILRGRRSHSAARATVIPEKRGLRWFQISVSKLPADRSAPLVPAKRGRTRTRGGVFLQTHWPSSFDVPTCRAGCTIGGALREGLQSEASGSSTEPVMLAIRRTEGANL